MMYQVQIGSHQVAVQAIPPAPISEYAERAREYLRLPPYCHISPIHYMSAQSIWLASNDELEIDLECPEVITTWSVHPSRKVVQSEAEGRSLRLRLGPAEPRYYIVEVNELPPLILVIDPQETDIPDRNHPDVIDLGSRLQNDLSFSARSLLIQEICREATVDGKTVYVPSGTYPVDTIHLQHLKGLKLYLESGAVFRTETSQPDENIHRHGIFIENCEDIRIWGRGCIDHQGYANYAHGRNDYNHGLVSYYVTNDLCPFTTQSPVTILRSQQIEIEGLMVRDARNFGFNLRRSDDITLRHCKVITPPASTPEYGDGFHTNSCVNVLIENCLAYCNDDCFASGHYTHFDDRKSGLHTIHGLVGWNPRANAVRLGFHTYYDQGDYLFENCDFAGMTCSGILVHPLKDAPEAHRYPSYGTVRFKNCSFNTSRLNDALIDLSDIRMERFELEDVEFSERKAIRIQGHAFGDGIKTLRLKRAGIEGKLIGDADVEAQNVEDLEIS